MDIKNARATVRPRASPRCIQAVTRSNVSAQPVKRQGQAAVKRDTLSTGSSVQAGLASAERGGVTPKPQGKTERFITG